MGPLLQDETICKGTFREGQVKEFTFTEFKDKTEGNWY